MRTDDGREVVVRVGPAKRDDVLPGSRVSILLPDGRTDSAALESQRPRESPTHIGPFVVTSIFFVGLAMLAFAIFLAVRGSTV